MVGKKMQQPPSLALIFKAVHAGKFTLPGTAWLEAEFRGAAGRGRRGQRRTGPLINNIRRAPELFLQRRREQNLFGQLTKFHRAPNCQPVRKVASAGSRGNGATDLPLIDNRIAFIEQLAPAATDPVNLAAFKEAYKDLLKMRERIVNPPPPVAPVNRQLERGVYAASTDEGWTASLFHRADHGNIEAA